MDEELGSDIYLDGIITVVDSKYGLDQLKNETDTINEAVKQVALADVLVLNKIDLVPDRSKIKDELRGINSSCPIVETERSKIDLEAILDLHAYDGSAASPDKFGSVEPSLTSPHLDQSVGTVTLRYDSKVKLQKVELFLQELLWDEKYKDSKGNNVQILRLKGHMALEGDDCDPIIIQGVHDTYDTYRTLSDCKDCTIVIIGRFLQFDILQKGLIDTLLS